MKTLLPVLIGVTLALASATGRADETDKDVLKLSIERKNLRDALNDWAQQTGYQLIAEINGDSLAPKVEGKLTAQEALERLLQGTSLTYQWMGERLVAVKEKPLVVPATLQSTQYEMKQPALPIARLSGEERTGRRLAANDQVAGGGAEPARMQPRSHNPEAVDVEELEQVVVTGTHIRGAAPVGSQLIVIDRKEIVASGHGRIQDLLEELPQNFSGSATEENRGIDAGAANWTRGTAVDLRGLGASSTLVLVNGHRQPAGGTEGAYVDISSIATSAVERVEVLADGASALYGADAIGGVVNFILRKDYEGMETDVRVATTDANGEDIRASQLVGTKWKGGNVLAGYQYSHRDPLLSRDTPYGALGGDMRRHGGDDFRIVGGNPATILDPLTFVPGYAIPADQDGRSLTVADLVPGQANYWDTVSRSAWVPEETSHSAFVALSQEITPDLELSFTGRYSRRETDLTATESLIIGLVPSSNPFYVNPYEDVLPGLVIVPFSFSPAELPPPNASSDTETYAFTGATRIRLTEQWELNAAANWGREHNEWSEHTLNVDAIASALADPDPSTALNVFGDGPVNNPATLNAMRETERRRGTSVIRSLDVIADGPLFDLPAGSVKLAAGADYREESVDADRGALSHSTGIFTRFPTIVGSMDRHVTSAFAEIKVPLLAGSGSSNRPMLEVAVAGRYEDYSDFGSTTNPKIGLNFAATPDLTLRGSWGTSFRAPRLNEVSPTANPPSAGAGFSFADPDSPTGRSNVLILGGANADLKEETAEMWSSGIEYKPAFAPGFAVAANYFELDYEDKIQVGGSGDRTLLLADQWAEIITRNPSQAEVNAICTSSIFRGPCPANVAAIIDMRLRNLGVVSVSGVDFNAEYRSGPLNVGFAGTKTLKYERAASDRAPLVDVLDTVRNPLSLRLRASLGWTTDTWNMNVWINYTGSYDDPAQQRDVGSWTTVNSSVAYSFEQDGWLNGTRVQLSAVNVLDEEPPFVNTFVGFDFTNANQMGRSVALNLTKRW